MTEDNPSNYSWYPDTTTSFTSNIYNNTYDSVTKTFYMHFGFGGGSRVAGQEGYTRQVYEKWVLIPAPVISSFTPQEGTAGTEVTISGKYFSGAISVKFGGKEATSFTVFSDSVLTAIVSGGNYGPVTVSNLTGTSLPKDDFFFSAPVVQDTLWRSLGVAGFSTGAVGYVSMTVNTSGLPYVVYQDKTNGNKAAVMKLGDNNTWEKVGDAASAGAAGLPNIIIGRDNTPYIAYIDSSVGSNRVSVQNFVNNQWRYLGLAGFDSLTGSRLTRVALDIDSNNAPNIVTNYTVAGGYHLHVNKFDGSNWTYVGENSLPYDLISIDGNADITIDKNTNAICVSTIKSDSAVDGISTSRYDGNKWGTLGSPQNYNYQNKNAEYYYSLKTATNGLPVLAIQDPVAKTLKIERFDGRSWQYYGNQYKSQGQPNYISLALDTTDMPYVLFEDDDYNVQGTVIKFNVSGDGSWERVGARGFAPSSYFSPNAISIGKNNVPYIAFSDKRYGDKVTVMHYENYGEFVPRVLYNTIYSIDDCEPWIKQYPDWTTLYDTVNRNGTTIEIQTQFQDEPGNLCNYQSIVRELGFTLFDTHYWWDGDSVKKNIGYLLRNYSFSFDNTPFEHQVGVRLFCTAGEVQGLLIGMNSTYKTNYTDKDIFIIRYDGPNENLDYYFDDEDKASDYTRIPATIHYYGENNEYCYFEFYTDHFSEFQIALSTQSVLPVSLMNFSATAQDHLAIIKWQTANEINTSYFSVQRSTDGIHFTNIGKVNATNTSGNHNYSYRDDLASLAGTKVYYRLQMVDKDGSSKESSIVSISLSNDQKIMIVPNPARSYFTVSGNLAAKNTMLITDMSKKTVLVKNNVTRNEKINISPLAKGIYMVRINNGNNFTVKKLIVE